MTARILAPLAVLAFTLVGCASNGPPAPTAEQVVAQLMARVPGLGAGGVVTAENDPNRLLGRPGQYTSAAAFTDRRVPADRRNDTDTTGVGNGGKAEVFATTEQAQARADYIGRVASALPAAAEYEYVSGPVLVRVTGALTPAQAEQYHAALG